MKDLVLCRATPVRSSYLKAMRQSPAHCLHAMQSDTPDRPITGPMELGLAVNHKVLGTGDVLLFPGKKRQGKAYDQFVEDNPGALILSKSGYDKATGMAEAVWANKLAVELLTSGVQEQTLTFDYLGRACRLTPDSRGVNGPGGRDYVSDLKTTRSADPEKFKWQSSSLGYDLQLGLYSEGIAANGFGMPQDAYIVAVESSAPYPITIFRMTDELLERGRRSAHLQMGRLIACEQSGQWPEYVQSIVDLEAPGDAELIFDDEEEADDA